MSDKRPFTGTDQLLPALGADADGKLKTAFATVLEELLVKEELDILVLQEVDFPVFRAIEAFLENKEAYDWLPLGSRYLWVQDARAQEEGKEPKTITERKKINGTDKEVFKDCMKTYTDDETKIRNYKDYPIVIYKKEKSMECFPYKRNHDNFAKYGKCSFKVEGCGKFWGIFLHADTSGYESEIFDAEGYHIIVGDLNKDISTVRPALAKSQESKKNPLKMVEFLDGLTVLRYVSAFRKNMQALVENTNQLELPKRIFHEYGIPIDKKKWWAKVENEERALELLKSRKTPHDTKTPIPVVEVTCLSAMHLCVSPTMVEMYTRATEEIQQEAIAYVAWKSTIDCMGAVWSGGKDAGACDTAWPMNKGMMMACQSAGKVCTSTSTRKEFACDEKHFKEWQKFKAIPYTDEERVELKIDTTLDLAKEHAAKDMDLAVLAGMMGADEKGNAKKKPNTDEKDLRFLELEHGTEDYIISKWEAKGTSLGLDLQSPWLPDLSDHVPFFAKIEFVAD